MSDSLAQQKRKKEIKQCALQLRKLSQIKENQRCADCGHKPAKWVSTNIGCWLCIRCSGIHRSLGVHISFVKSVTLDDWSFKLLKRFESLGGNHAVNSIYEASLKKRDKITYDCNEYQALDFIKDKYVKKKWIAKPHQKQKPLKPKAKKQHSHKAKIAHHAHAAHRDNDADPRPAAHAEPRPHSHPHPAFHSHAHPKAKQHRSHHQRVRELPQIREQAAEVAVDREQKSADFTDTWIKFEDEATWLEPTVPISISMELESESDSAGHANEVEDLLDLEQLRQFALPDLSSVNAAESQLQAEQRDAEVSIFDTLELSQNECKPANKSAAILSKYHQPPSSHVNMAPMGRNYNYPRGANSGYYALQQAPMYAAYGAVNEMAYDARSMNGGQIGVVSEYEMAEAPQSAANDNPFRENNASQYECNAGFNPFSHISSLMNNSNGYYVFNANVSC